VSGDGRRHIAQAVERRCAAVLWESEGFDWNKGWSVPNAGVRGLRTQAGFIAHEFFGRPSDALWVCGITGTNGKTTCSHWLSSIFSAKKIKAAVIGTLGSGFPGALEPTANTTPDALEVHRLLAQMKAQGAQAVAMEVSSHGLDQGRVNGVAFDCALLTNLTHDHLDYHRSMAAYGEAKALLFNMPGLETAVLNLDEAFGVQLAQRLRARGVRTIGYGFSADARDATIAEQFVSVPNPDAEEVHILSSWGSAKVALPRLGRFNVANALGVLGCLVARGIPFAEAAAMLASLPPVPGRMQVIGDRPLVVVDYAHTPDALEKVLATLRPVAAARGGRLAVVFGAGGDRDAAKRPVMGQVAARLADDVVLTSDNPRSENPQAILDAIRAGVARACLLEPDRAKAIAAAIDAARDADVVLLAGKGHEATQEVAGRKLPFSDAEVAARALARRRAG
jgi:UDP-N-acetylmuramoyl-L-alanyl-D-glutamate--2,6-diaminopimelate ligase